MSSLCYLSFNIFNCNRISSFSFWFSLSSPPSYPPLNTSHGPTTLKLMDSLFFSLLWNKRLFLQISIDLSFYNHTLWSNLICCFIFIIKYIKIILLRTHLLNTQIAIFEEAHNFTRHNFLCCVKHAVCLTPGTCCHWHLKQLRAVT